MATKEQKEKAWERYLSGDWSIFQYLNWRWHALWR